MSKYLSAMILLINQTYLTDYLPGGCSLIWAIYVFACGLKGMVFEPFWSKIGCVHSDLAMGVLFRRIYFFYINIGKF